LVALLAIVAMLQVALGHGSRGAPRTTLWFCIPAIAILVLPVFARHSGRPCVPSTSTSTTTSPAPASAKPRETWHKRPG